MAATVATVAHLGLEAVEVQVQLSSGIPRFTIVDLPTTRPWVESRERVRAALSSKSPASCCRPRSSLSISRQPTSQGGVAISSTPAFPLSVGSSPKTVALGFLRDHLPVFANLLTLFIKKGTNVPNRYGAADCILLSRALKL